MREIKFRGKRVDTGEWVYGFLIKCGITGKLYIFPLDNDANESEKDGEEGCLRLITFEVIPETVGQYTGLKCKNNKEIYEGDIVDNSYISPLSNEKVLQKYIIIYENSLYVMMWIDKERKIYYDSYLWMKNKDIEVIGNIYDNLELLEVNNEDN